MSLDNFIIPPTYESKLVDVSSLSHDSLQRIAEMSRARRQRVMAEDEVWAEQVKFRDEASSMLSQAVGALEEEEQLGREVLRKAEAKALDRVLKMADEEAARYRGESERLRKLRELERRRDRKVKELEQQLYRESFRHFWQAHRSGGVAASGATGALPGAASESPHSSVPRTREDEEHAKVINQTTAVLRHAYQYSAPQFATDPEELWRRGVTIAPDLQRSVDLKGPNGEALHLPAYHDLAIKLRAKYDEHSQQRAARTQGSPSPAATSQSPHRAASAATTAANGFSPYSQYVQRYPYSVPPS